MCLSSASHVGQLRSFPSSLTLAGHASQAENSSACMYSMYGLVKVCTHYSSIIISYTVCAHIETDTQTHSHITALAYVLNWHTVNVQWPSMHGCCIGYTVQTIIHSSGDYQIDSGKRSEAIAARIHRTTHAGVEGDIAASLLQPPPPPPPHSIHCG